MATDPVTAAAVTGGAEVVKGVSGYKAGQASSKAAMATAMYNRQITELNAKMEQDRGTIVRTITERNAEVVGENASYNAYALEQQADQVLDQNAFDMFMAERQYDIFTAQKRAKWGTAGVTMAGSPAVVALADAQSAALNLANIEQRGLQASSRLDQAAKMTRYKGKVEYNNLMQTAWMQQYNSDVQRANIINEGNMNYYSGMSKAYQAQQQAQAALISGIAGGIGSFAKMGGFADSTTGSVNVGDVSLSGDMVGQGMTNTFNMSDAGYGLPTGSGFSLEY